ncbi:hypothetical protein H6764_01435 [Candidatus Nomurabacteria bacterium]|nr:hypothetical protein [Candidatus Nomurabacteria bacterium]
MSELTTKEINLDLSNNIARIARFLEEENNKRVEQFIAISQEALDEINNRKLNYSIAKAVHNFEMTLNEFRSNNDNGKQKNLSEDFYTHSNIIRARAVFA